MSRLGFYVLCGTLCSLVVLGQGGGVTPNKTVLLDLSPTHMPITTENTTSPAPTTETTTEPPKTTTTTSTTTTSTTTPQTITPTTTPSTTTTTTTTTTPAPPIPPTPTPKPTPPGPLPSPSVGNYTVKEKNVTCIIIQFAAQLNVTYTKDVDNSTTLDHKCLNVPPNATMIDSSCSAKNGTEQWFTISWSEGNSTASNMTLVFLKNGTNYNLQSLNVTLPAEIFPNASKKNPIELFHGVAWQTPLATSYRCNPATPLTLSSDIMQTAGTITLSQLQEEAFRTSSGTAFSAARDCGSGDVPDAVPIAVGCALGGLVIVVLVAYLVGRRRSASRGYLSM